MVTIGELEPANFGLVAQWLSRPEINQWLSGEWRDCGATPSLVAMAVRNRRNRLYLVRYDTLPCGLVALGEIDSVDKMAMVWYLLGNDQLAGRGVTSQAVRILSDTAFKELQLAVLYAWIMENNVPSRRVLERSGFQECGRIRNAANSLGQQVDRIYFDLTSGQNLRAGPRRFLRAGSIEPGFLSTPDVRVVKRILDGSNAWPHDHGFRCHSDGCANVSPFLLHDRVESLPSSGDVPSSSNQIAYEDSMKMPLAVPSGDKGLLTKPYGSFPIQFVRLVTSYFPNLRKSPMVLERAAGAKDLAPKPNALIPPTMRSNRGPAWLLAKRLPTHFWCSLDWSFLRLSSKPN